MSENHLFPIPKGLEKSAWIDDPGYQKMYAMSNSVAIILLW